MLELVGGGVRRPQRLTLLLIHGAGVWDDIPTQESAPQVPPEHQHLVVLQVPELPTTKPLCVVSWRGFRLAKSTRIASFWDVIRRAGFRFLRTDLYPKSLPVLHHRSRSPSGRPLRHPCA